MKRHELNRTPLNWIEPSLSGLNLNEPNQTELTCREERTEQKIKYVNVTKGTQHSSIGSFHPLYLPDPPRSLYHSNYQNSVKSVYPTQQNPI